MKVWASSCEDTRHLCVSQSTSPLAWRPAVAEWASKEAEPSGGDRQTGSGLRSSNDNSFCGQVLGPLDLNTRRHLNQIWLHVSLKVDCESGSAFF